MLNAAPPTGAPEISKKAINQCSDKGGEEMFIIGKNFMKGTVVYFEEVKNDQVIWTKEAEIDQDFFQAVSCSVFLEQELVFSSGYSICQREVKGCPSNLWHPKVFN